VSDRSPPTGGAASRLHGAALLFLLSLLGCQSAPSKIVAARVTAVEGSRESIVYDSVTVSFDNPTLGPCQLTRYAVSWPGGRAEAVVNTALPPGTSVRTTRVNPSDGHIQALTVGSASVAVFARCATPPAGPS
jgi:hypothetical protein